MWLERNGAKVLDPTNPYELLRFKNANGTGVIYNGKRGITITGEAEEGWKRFTRGDQHWKLVTRHRQSLKARKLEIAARDGMICFAHGDAKHINELTIEHLFSFAQGGTDNINNLILVCEPANQKLGNLPVAKKIELIMQMRASKAANTSKKNSISLTTERNGDTIKTTFEHGLDMNFESEPPKRPWWRFL